MTRKVDQEYVKSLDVLRRENSEKMHSSAVRWNEMANTRSSDMSKHLFTIASFVLPISLSPLTQEGFIASSSNLTRILLILAWVSFVASLISGLIHLTKEVRFFNKWANQENARSKVYSKAILTLSPQKAFDLFSRMNAKSMKLASMPSTAKPIFLRTQQVSLVFGITLIGIILTSQLFTSKINCLSNQTSLNKAFDALEMHDKTRHFNMGRVYYKFSRY